MSNADVIIFGDVDDTNSLTQAEVGFAQQYVSAGHNVIGTYLIFSANYQLEPLFGFKPIGSSYNYISSSLPWRILQNTTLTNRLPNPWTSSLSWPYNCVPTTGWASTIGSATIVTGTSDNYGVVTLFNSGSYSGIYISYLAEYMSKQYDYQLLYNAITYGQTSGCSSYTTCNQCSTASCVWCLDNGSCESQVGSCASYIKHPQYCPALACSTFTSCSSCLSNGNNQNCDWCLDTQSCFNIGSTSCDDVLNNPKFCPEK